MTFQTPIGIKVRARYSKNLSLQDVDNWSIGIVKSFWRQGTQ
jgi:hypothetical protein